MGEVRLGTLRVVPLMEYKEAKSSEDADGVMGLVVDAGLSLTIPGDKFGLRCKGVDIEFQLWLSSGLRAGFGHASGPNIFCGQSFSIKA